jgi:hypothetical protein
MSYWRSEPRNFWPAEYVQTAEVAPKGPKSRRAEDTLPILGVNALYKADLRCTDGRGGIIVRVAETNRPNVFKPWFQRTRPMIKQSGGLVSA